MRQLLTDLRALETMLREGLIESDTRRIGAEQELFLVDDRWQPALNSTAILEAVNDPHYTTELGLFNLEINLDPMHFEGDCLSRMEAQLEELLTKLRETAREMGTELIMTGILPTLTKEHLTLDHMTPKPRYFALNAALNRLRGGVPYDFRIKGVDELHITHDSVMVEACNTSFQVHFQVSPAEFARRYNIAQAVAGPVLAAAVNAPLLFDKRLWQETRIALFQQAVDTRGSAPHQRELRPRVRFGNHWIKESVLEIFQEDVARFRVLLATDLDEDPFELLQSGRVPRLQALQLHNGTVYRWNRACYGISAGRAHLRIENRILPSGPTVQDEIANAAFWFGLMNGVANTYEDITAVMEFEDVKANFLAAAQAGLNAQFTWIDGQVSPAQRLICDQLLPLAREGLRAAGIDPKESEHYLQIIDQRVCSGQTGSQWLLKSYAALRKQGTRAERLSALTAAIRQRQQNGQPVHEWSLARIEEGGGWKQSYLRVEQYMDTDLFTVNQDELVDLVANLMLWKHSRHVLVEDNRHRLVGIVSHRTLLRLIGDEQYQGRKNPIPVSAIMYRDPVTVTPETPTLEAIALMRRKGISCLPVVKDEHLVGLVTEQHFMDIARQLLEQQLRE
jgi:CBS domain-containing protein/gamma-glutamylcysteine synthetase